MTEPIYIKNEQLKHTYNEFIPNVNNSAFIFRIFKDAYINDYRHLHSEYELIYIKHGSGTKNIGDICLPCKQSDITLIGSGIPHFYQIYPEKDKKEVEIWVIQFDINFMGANFYEYSENTLLKNLIKAAAIAVDFKDPYLSKAITIFSLLNKAEIHDRIIIFLTLLGELANPKGYSTILNSYEATKIIDHSTDRLMLVKNHIACNYSQPISIAEMANIVHLSKSAFCNLFKKRFNTCFSNYLNEIRISRASKMLAETDFTINDIWNKCGFENQSYFNRIFKKYYGTSPYQYRKTLNGTQVKHRIGIGINR